MSKWNETSTEKQETNAAGTPGYKRKSFKQEVLTVITNSMLNSRNFYESENDRLKRIEDFIANNPDDAKFLAQAMVYTRTVANLRSVSHYMAVILLENVKGSSFLRKALYKTMNRPDDATEILALWNSRNSKIPNALRRAIKDVLERKFDAYQLKKYSGGKKVVKVSDLIKLAHPKGRDSNQSLMFKQAIEGSLPAIKTAQTVNAGDVDRAKEYQRMLKSKKIGLMAALKNLKNMIEANISDKAHTRLGELLRNEYAINKSGVLPFRFYQAYEIISELKMDRFKQKELLTAIEDGFKLSAGNLGIVSGNQKVAIMLDESGSMWGNPFMQGKVMSASMLSGLKEGSAIGYLWSDNTREMNVGLSPMNFIKSTRTSGGGTNLAQAMTDLIKTKTPVDVMVIFTDMQITDLNRWGSSETLEGMISRYKKISPNVKVIFWNLQGYGGATPLRMSDDVLEVSGFSDNILKVIPKLLKDREAFVKEVELIEL